MNWYKTFQLEKFAIRDILYHGTSVKNLYRIINQGLIPDPRERVWMGDADSSTFEFSQASFPGSYLTNSTKVALDSARYAQKGDSGGIIAVQSEKRDLILDEDTFSTFVRFGLAKMLGGSLTYENLKEAFVEYQNGYLDSKIKVASSEILKLFFNRYPPGSKEKIQFITQNTKSLIEKLLEALLVRSFSYYLGFEDKEYSDERLDINKIPSYSDANAKFREYQEAVTRKLSYAVKFLSQKTYTARYPESISFSGSNKILSAIYFNYTPKQDKKDNSIEIKFLYGDSSDAAREMLSDIRISITENIKFI